MALPAGTPESQLVGLPARTSQPDSPTSPPRALTGTGDPADDRGGISRRLSQSQCPDGPAPRHLPRDLPLDGCAGPGCELLARGHTIEVDVDLQGQCSGGKWS